MPNLPLARAYIRAMRHLRHPIDWRVVWAALWDHRRGTFDV
ncbi:MAG TPA: hypothetical protein VF234_04900 [Limnochordia bacterium]